MLLSAVEHPANVNRAKVLLLFPLLTTTLNNSMRTS